MCIIIYLFEVKSRGSKTYLSQEAPMGVEKEEEKKG